MNKLFNWQWFKPEYFASWFMIHFLFWMKYSLISHYIKSFIRFKFHRFYWTSMMILLHLTSSEIFEIPSWKLQREPRRKQLGSLSVYDHESAWSIFISSLVQRSITRKEEEEEEEQDKDGKGERVKKMMMLCFISLGTKCLWYFIHFINID